MRTAVWGALGVLLVCAAPLSARAATWGAGADGVCEPVVEMDADRGVRAYANAVTLPFRSLLASAQGDWKTWAMLPFSFGVSLFEGTRDVGTGTFDLLTLGYFRFSDVEEWDFAPVLFMPVREHRFGELRRPLDCGAGSGG